MKKGIQIWIGAVMLLFFSIFGIAAQQSKMVQPRSTR